EDRLVYERLNAQADLFIERYRAGAAHSAKGIEVFPGSTGPAVVATRRPGVHDEKRNGRDVHVLVREGGGERFVLVDAEQGFWVIEEHVTIALAIGVLAAVLLALLIARLTVNRVVAPLTALAEAVEGGRTDELPSLETPDEI